MAMTMLAAFEGVDIDRLLGNPNLTHDWPAAMPCSGTLSELRKTLDRLSHKLYGELGVSINSEVEDTIQEVLVGLVENRDPVLSQPVERWGQHLWYLSKYGLMSKRRKRKVEEIRREQADRLPTAEVPAVTALPRTPGTREWSKGEIVGAFLEFREREGRPPGYPDLRGDSRSDYLPSHVTVQKKFGSVAAAVRASGMDYIGRAKRRSWTPLEAATACDEFRRVNGAWPSTVDLQYRVELPGCSPCTRIFGGVARAKVAAGCERILAEQHKVAA